MSSSQRHQDVQIMRAIRDLDTAEDAITQDLTSCKLVLNGTALERVTEQLQTAQRAVRQARARLRSI